MAKKAEAKKAALTVGAPVTDGSVFAGVTADKKQKVFAAPVDLSLTATFNNAAKAVAQLNAEKYLGHDDWQIPTQEQLQVLFKNQNKGALKDSFETADKGHDVVYPRWYWSSTTSGIDPTRAWASRFSNGGEVWHHKDSYQLSCRPVRVEPAQ